MIIFHEISWMNFLSTGNAPTKIKLNGHPTTLILGENGSGKSTFLDALCYALFKKPFRKKIRKDQIINNINTSDCQVEVKFSIGTNEYVVRRGINPDYSELYINGEKRKKDAKTKDDQAFLEEDILKVDFESFTQVVILGKAKYTPFMQLEAAERRNFIEHILDIAVFSSMSDILKTKMTTVKTTLDTVTKDISMETEKAALVHGFIQRLELEQSKATIDAEKQIDEQNQIIDLHMPDISRLTDTIETENEALTTKTAELNAALAVQVDELNTELEAKIEELTETIVDTSSLEEKIRKLSTLKGSIETNAKNAQTNIEFYTQNDSCKTCKQNIDEEFRANIVTEKSAQISEFESGLLKISEEIKKKTDALREAKESNAAVQLQGKKITMETQAKIRELTASTQDEIRSSTSVMQQHIRALTNELQIHQSAVSAAHQLIKKMKADMQKDSAAVNIEEQYEKWNKLLDRVKSFEKDKELAIENKHFYDVAAVLLKDTGIKAAIIKQYLPMINKLVNHYLTELNFFLSFSINENFKETFKSRHRDTLQYYSFSEGEKLRIDLALLFTWRDISRMKNSCATNLLILDEVIDGSMDQNGTEFFIKMINDLGESSNVFVISHKQDSSLDKFKCVMQFVKEKNFSQVVYLTT